MGEVGYVLERVACSDGHRLALGEQADGLPLLHPDGSPCRAQRFTVTERTDRGHAYGRLLGEQIRSGARARLLGEGESDG